MSFIEELRRRNVIRVALAYLAGSWLLIQILETLLPVFGLPEISMRFIVIVLAIGFIPALIAAWVFELTPDGLSHDSGQASSVDPISNKRFDRIIIATLVLAVAVFALHTFIIDPARDAAKIEQVAREARTEAFKESFGEKSIAVLPFVNMSPDPDQEYFSDGIAEELLNLLARIEGLRVISRTSSFQFKESGLSLAEIAERLDVAHILEGSVRKSGEQIRITAQLIDARADAHLWSATYDRKLEDIFAIQDEVAAHVVEQLKVTLSVGLPKAKRHNPAAYPLYIQATQILALDDPDNMDRAEELLHRVLEIEPDYIDAELALAAVYEREASIADHEKDYALVKEFFAKRKKILDGVAAKFPDNAALNSQLAWDALFRDTDLAAAARHLEIAVEAEPRNYHSLLPAMVLSENLGRSDLTIKIGEYLTRRDPLGFWAHANLADAYLNSGQTARAISTYRTAAAISPKAGAIQWKLGFALLVNGEPEAALARYENDDHLPYRLHGRALALHDLGDRDGSIAALAELRQMGETDEVGIGRWPFGYARAYAWIGDADTAFKYLYMIQQQDPIALRSFANNAYFEKIKDDPRWQPLVDSVAQQLSQIDFNPKLPAEILGADWN